MLNTGLWESFTSRIPFFATMKFWSFVFCLALSYSLAAQSIVKGMVVDTEDEAIGFCHVYNQTLGLGKVSDKNGQFAITAQKDDTLAFSYVGYESLKVAMTSVLLSNYLKVTLPEDSVLLPAITIYADPNYRVPLNFKGQMIEIEGVSKSDRDPIKPGDISLGAEGVGGVPVLGVGIAGPITFFSKDAVEARKAAEAFKETKKTITYQKFIAQDSVRDKLREKYQLTSLEYDVLITRLNETYPGVQQAYLPKEIWNWIVSYFDRMSPIIKSQ